MPCSRDYVLKRVAVHVRDREDIGDCVSSQLALLEILAPQRMAGLLAEALKRRGFAVEANKAQRDEGEGIALEVDLETGEVTLRESHPVELEGSAERQRQVSRRLSAEEQTRIESELDAAARRALETQLQEQRDRARQDSTKKLERRLGDLQREIDGIANEVTREALKEKAQSLGLVENVVEDEHGGLTIEIRV